MTGLVSGAEVAFFSLNLKLLEQEESDSKFVAKLKKALANPRKLLATILVANNFINIAVVLLLAHLTNFDFLINADPIIGVLLEVIVITAILLFFGEILPKIFANRNSLLFAKYMLGPLEFIDRYLLFWLTWPMNRIGYYFENKVAKRTMPFPLERVSKALELTRDDETSEDEQKILKRILNFGDIGAKQIMCPRAEIYCLASSLEVEHVIEQIRNSNYSRIPIYEENLDQIKGILYIKDLLPYLSKPHENWHDVLRAPFYVPENKKLDDLLIDFKKNKKHLAIVVNEYGGTSGLITLEDILEQVLGDIRDEHDESNFHHKKIEDLNYLFDAKINLMDFFKIIGRNSSEVFHEVRGEAESLGGLLLELTKEFPKVGKTIRHKGYTFKVNKIEGNRITEVRVTLPPLSKNK